MILLILLFFVVGVITFAISSKLAIGIRVGISLAVFVIPSAIAYCWLAQVGDKPLSGSSVVTPKHEQERK
jgi:hypothetical protein